MNLRDEILFFLKEKGDQKIAQIKGWANIGHAEIVSELLYMKSRGLLSISSQNVVSLNE